MQKHFASLLTLLLLLVAGLMTVPEARAEVRFNFGTGIGPEPDFCRGPFDPSNCWEPPTLFDTPGFYRPYYFYPPVPRTARISCDRGARILSVSGYHAVRAIDCRGDSYRYLALRNSRALEISMWSRTGRIYNIVRR